jgi:SulP family sulfate permease
MAMSQRMFAYPSWLTRLTPFTRWWPLVNRETLRSDAVAGFTGAVVVLPQGVAFATIAGMPPEYGLYAGMVPAVIAALFGSSWHLVSGPTTAASIVLFSALSVYAEPGTAHYVQLALTLTLMVGLIELAMGFARLGTLVNFISHSVVIGFTAGAAILIASNQIKHFFGVDIPRGGHLHHTLLAFGTQLHLINPYVTAVGLVTVLSGIAVKRYLPRVPYMIVALLAASLVSVGLNGLLGNHHTGIRTVGALPSTLPPLSMPDLSLHSLRMLAPAALAATLFALTEAVSIARALAVRAGQHVDGNQEFIGQGLSNLFGSFFSAYVATGSFNRSGLNYDSGAKTPVAAMLAGILLMGIVLLVAPLAAYLPNAAMAGVLFLVAWGLIDFHHIRQVIRTSRSDTAIMATTFFSTLFLELEFAIFLGVILSLVLYLSRTSRPQILIRIPNPADPGRKFITDAALPECPQVRIIRIDGSLFFGAVSHVQETLQAFQEADPNQKHLVIVASGINFIDVAGAEFLALEARKRRAEGGGLYLIRVKPGVYEPLKRGGYLKDIGEENIFPGKTQALEAIFERLDRERCLRCSRRIFRECQTLPPPQIEEGREAAQGATPGGALSVAPA